MILVAQLESVAGKKKYGYLPKTVKKTVDDIVDLMEQLPIIDGCYQIWWELQCQIEDFYSERERQRPPLSEQKAFRSIKNAVIQEAENIRMGKVTFEDEEMKEPTEFSNLSYDCRELWMVTQDDTVPMADRDEAAAQLIRKAESGDPDAQYLVGKLYRDGPVLIPDSVESQYWFDQLAQQGHVPAQYALGKLYLTDDAEVHDTELGIQWLEYAAHHGSDCAAY
jgi:TPR repeat protein